MNNQEINNKLEQLEADLNTLKESMSISEENISLLMIIANQDEKIKQLKRELSIQKTISDTQFTINNPINFDKIDANKLLEQVKNDIEPYKMKDYFHTPNPFDRTLFPSASDKIGEMMKKYDTW